jgi:cation diffusion facilitator family transporter
VAGLLGVALGFPLADPVAGLLITAAIVWITVSSARQVAARLTDAVDEEVIGRIEELASSIDQVREVHDVKARWAGRSLFVQLHICVDENLPLSAAHSIGEEVRHEIMDSVAGVSQALVHLDPWGEGKDQSLYHPGRHRHEEGDPPG